MNPVGAPGHRQTVPCLLPCLLPCHVQTRVGAEQKACLCLMHPSFAADPRHFKFRQARRDKETLPTDMGGAGPGQVETSSRANCRGGPLPRDKERRAPSPMSCRQIYQCLSVTTRFRGASRIWLGATGPMGWPGWGPRTTRDGDWGSSAFAFNVTPKPSKLRHRGSRIADRGSLIADLDGTGFRLELGREVHVRLLDLSWPVLCNRRLGCRLSRSRPRWLPLGSLLLKVELGQPHLCEGRRLFCGWTT